MSTLRTALLLLAGLAVACAGPDDVTTNGAPPTDTAEAPSEPPSPPESVPSGAVATVDTLIAPARIASTDTLRLRLRGTVGSNGCYSLARIETARRPGRLIVAPIVRYRGGPDVACTMAIVPLDATHAVPPPHSPGRLTIIVPQPGRPAVTATVAVRDE